MPIEILMPSLSPNMEKGDLTQWLKKVGDTVKAGDALVEIESDKATIEVEAAVDGVLAKILVADGTKDVPVNQLIAVIAGTDEAAAASASGPAPGAASGERIFASPLARRIAAEGQIGLHGISGSGPHGRILERDVRAAIAGDGARRAGAAPRPGAAPAAQGLSADAVRKLFEPGSFEEIPHDSMRQTIARRLVEAKSTIPHFYLSVDCELGALLALREQLNACAPGNKDGQPGFRISVTDFVVKALALALRDVPDANVSWSEAAMLRHRHCDIGVAVAIAGGLVTPIVRKAETKTLFAIATETKDCAARAKARKLEPHEYQGGSSTVSNLGMLGIRTFSAVINPPQATILAVGAGEKRVIVRNGQPAVADMMSVTLATDHRAVDGALGAELLAAFRKHIERPLGMLV